MALFDDKNNKSSMSLTYCRKDVFFAQTKKRFYPASKSLKHEEDISMEHIFDNRTAIVCG